MPHTQGPVTGSSEAPHAEEVSIADVATPDAQTQFLAETDAHSGHVKRGWIIVAVTAVIVVGVSAALWALWPRPAPQVTPVSQSSTPASVGAGDYSAATMPTLATAAQPTTSAAGQTVAPAPGAGGAQPRQSPNGVVARGVPLGAAQGPPSRTLTMIVVPKGFTEATYAVMLQPYGWGPGGQAGGRLLAKITAAKPTNDSAIALKTAFAGRNVSAWCSPAAAAVLNTGGIYRCMMQVRPQGDVGVLYISSAKRVK